MKTRFIQQQVNTVGLIAHYKLWDGLMTTDKVFDYSLGGKVGTLKGTSPIMKYPGIDLPGTDEYIEIDDHVDFSPILTPLTISAWVYMHDATSFGVVSKGVYNTNAEFSLRTTGTDYIAFWFYDESVNDCYIGQISNGTITSYQNQWIHLVGTSDGSKLSSGVNIYLNGEQFASADNENAVFVAVENLNAPVYIGRYSTSYANGLINDVMIFNLEKSVAEVKSIYSQTRGRYSA